MAPTEIFDRIILLFGVTPYNVRYHFRTLKKAVAFALRRRVFPVFSELAIETTAYCNRRCSACPVSVAPRPKDGAMDDALLDKIVTELADIRYSGRIALHFFNEPLADSRIVEKVRMLARRVPKAYVEMNSNGDFCTRDLIQDLFEAGLSYLVLTAYTDNAYARLKTIYDQLSWRQQRRIALRRAPVFIGNRAGTLDHLSVPESLHADCFQPIYKLVINYKGEALICTSDYSSKSVMGNVAHQSLLEIWRGEAFEKARTILRRRERNRIPACAGCNQLSTPLTIRFLPASEVADFNKRAKGHARQGACNPPSQ